jgi:aminoglycoside phosphotransferase (APT) family kinase protein
MEVAFSALVRSVPREQASCLVHGDPKLDNCLLDPDGNLRALLDWELAAAGDPLADLGMLLAYWAEPGDVIVALQDPPSAEPGFATREELAERYAQASGLDVARLSYYVGFALWKLACIVQGVLRRIVDGGFGADGVDPGPFAAQVVRLGDFAADVLTGRDRAAG